MDWVEIALRMRNYHLAQILNTIGTIIVVTLLLYLNQCTFLLIGFLQNRNSLDCCNLIRKLQSKFTFPDALFQWVS